MYLRNTSRYPTAEVRALVDFATRGVNLAKVAVHVKNSAGPLRGRAYMTVPRISSARAGAESLIVLAVGAKGFPCDNMVTRVVWGPWLELSEFQERNYPATGAHAIRWVGERQEARYGETIRHPYGGKHSPLIVVNDWREALVTVAAHEARHIHQYRHKRPLSEVDCERFAAKALERYRQWREQVTR